ncbi:MAG: bifunctional phosphoribosylaminoimidazolecarboxamide formyltransferase/IMP cyclohydrolase [Solirubrobacteraceae bacterium]|nr:bifunctional phosphoribosylaminoimidazolecarboxamide formyltransferase/IMP cyclohydrolase [Solirubrobacteraceae bacterium]
MRVRRAVLSVSDKRGIVDFARGLAALGVELVSTGGTAAALREAGLEVRAIDDLTGFPEIMDGRVKTLNPRLYAGLLALRDKPEHVAQVAEHGIELVDLVCVNLYPFEQTVARGDATVAEIIEQIDIGGPTMIRAAAKNSAFAAVVTRPESYDAVLEELAAGGGLLTLETRESLAAEAFAATARYDAAISRWFAERRSDLPDTLVRAYEKRLDLPYGENPHQRAAYYEEAGARRSVLTRVRQLHGKELSFNNILDLDGACAVLAELGDDEPACVIVKHNNPCGVALGDAAEQAYRKAFAGDPVSAFGGIIALNRPVDAQLAEALSEQFLEALIAPGFDEQALEILCRRPNVRLLEDTERRARPNPGFDLRQVDGGLLVQDRDVVVAARERMEVVSARKPTDEQWRDLLFAWRVCRHVRSNAIVVARDGATLGIGAGQMSRVDSVRIAVGREWIADRSGLALASDAFFPFADGPVAAMDGGVTAFIQPGGSIRDEEVIAAVNARDAVMVFTRRRHFRH